MIYQWTFEYKSHINITAFLAVTAYNVHNSREERVVSAITSEVSIHYVGESAWQGRGVQTTAVRKQNGQGHKGPGRGMSPRNAAQQSPSSIPLTVVHLDFECSRRLSPP